MVLEGEEVDLDGVQLKVSGQGVGDGDWNLEVAETGIPPLTLGNLHPPVYVQMFPVCMYVCIF